MGGTGKAGADRDMLKIGFVYDRPPESQADGQEVSAEYEDQETIDWLRSSLGKLGEVTDIPWDHGKAVREIMDINPDVIFNITEASGSRNRESLVPAIAESLGIPCTGSDSVGLGVSLDKYITKVIAAHAEVKTPPFALVMPDDDEEVVRAKAAPLHFPLIIKPNTGGSSMGIRSNSRVRNIAELLKELSWSATTFREPILMEEFIAGREVTAGILEDKTFQLLPIAEITFGEEDPEAFYSIEKKSIHEKKVTCPAPLPGELADEVNTAAKAVFQALGCAGLARVDFRISIDNVPNFIEINPLPGLSPFYSIFPMQAKARGIDEADMVRLIVENALQRGSRSY